MTDKKNNKTAVKTKTNKQKTTSKKQVTIGKAEYINSLTGEVEEFDVIDQKDQDFNFQKIWLGHLLESLNVIGGAKIKVLNYILANKNSENQVIGTQRAMAREIGVSLPVVNETLKLLIESKAIKKVSSGVLMLNPEIIFKGSHSRRMSIMLRYTKTETIEQEQEKQQETITIK